MAGPGKMMLAAREFVCSGSWQKRLPRVERGDGVCPKIMTAGAAGSREPL